jgi:arginase
MPVSVIDKSSPPRPAVIAVLSGLGAPDRRCENGPSALLAGGLLRRLAAHGIPIRLAATLFPGASHGKSPYAAIAELCGRLAHQVAAALASGAFPVVLGGDHSCAIGTWSGAAAAMADKGPIGLIWIDAHMDSHTPHTSHTGMPHGMPLAALLGRGADPKLEREVLGLVHEGHLSPRHVCIVGARSYEPEEDALLRELDVKVFRIEEVQRRGLPSVLADAVAIASAGTAAYGISLDLDAVDPDDAPGVGSPVAGGLSGTGLVEALRAVGGDPRLLALEIVEFNPQLDPAGKTAALVEKVLMVLLGPAARKAAPSGAAP